MIGQPQSSVIERGSDFAVYQIITPVPGADGQTVLRTNRFTLLENGLHYREDGRWKESRDLIEPFSEGAIARYGPNQAIFSPDLKAAAVFDIQMADGGRLRGGVRAIQLTDLANERSLVLGTVKDTAPGELLPPDQIVYRDAFDGIAADVVVVWRHNLFSHNVVMRQRPALPRDWDPASTRLEVLTELIECPEPDVRRQLVTREGEAALEDDVVLDFGGLTMLMGQSFPVPEEDAWAFGGPRSGPEGRPVLKQLQELPDGRRFLVESVAWTDAEAAWQSLSRTADARPAGPLDSELPPVGEQETQVAAISTPAADPADPSWRLWPELPSDSPPPGPMLVAQAEYEPDGYVVDFETIPTDGTPTTFVSGHTYYIKTSYYMGSAVTFQPGCTIEFKHNAYLLLYGPMNFPDTFQTPVFTSKDDNNFGEVIAGVPGEADSDGDPSDQKAAQAIWVYYLNSATTVRNVRVRWAQRGIQYDVNSGVYITHSLQQSLLEHCDTGVYVNLANATLSLSNVEKNAVTTPVQNPTGYGTISGSITQVSFPTGTAFRGVDGISSFAEGDDAGSVADTMGAVGETYFVELLNGRVAVFEKSSGRRMRQAMPSVFFSLTDGDDEYPAGSTMTDPRILYDPASKHWFACQLDYPANNVLLAVSKGEHPIPPTT
ncbi:MAG: hypothetical protein H7A45_09955, partial [Verrucomicrobiales bacterium]|nr:hypothetical protein [Verrucomicrobiales bacterium]